MMQRKWSLYIADIIESAEKILAYTDGVTYEQFLLDQKLIDAVERNFEIIGEAARNIPADVKDRYEDIPWVEMIGMRNAVAHEYFQVGLKVVWQAVQTDLPELTVKVKKMLKDFE